MFQHRFVRHLVHRDGRRIVLPRRRRWRSARYPFLIALIIAMLVWEFLNLLLLGWILHLLEGVSLEAMLRDQSWLSCSWHSPCVGVATSAVALLLINALLAAFALPAILLWFTFRANQAGTKVRGASAMGGGTADSPHGEPTVRSDRPGRRPSSAISSVRTRRSWSATASVTGHLHPGPGPSSAPDRWSKPFRATAESVVDLGPDTLPPRWTRGGRPPGNPRRRDPAVGLGASHRPAGSTCCRGPAAPATVVASRRRPLESGEPGCRHWPVPFRPAREAAKLTAVVGQGIGQDRGLRRGTAQLCCGVRPWETDHRCSESAASPAGGGSVIISWPICAAARGGGDRHPA